MNPLKRTITSKEESLNCRAEETEVSESVIAEIKKKTRPNNNWNQRKATQRKETSLRISDCCFPLFFRRDREREREREGGRDQKIQKRECVCEREKNKKERKREREREQKKKERKREREREKDHEKTPYPQRPTLTVHQSYVIL